MDQKNIKTKEVFAVVVPNGNISYSYNKGYRLYDSFTGAKRGLAHSEKGSSIAKFEFTGFVYDGRKRGYEKDIQKHKSQIGVYKRMLASYNDNPTMMSKYLTEIETVEDKIKKLEEKIQEISNEE